MELIKDEKILNELKIALNYYIKGLMILNNNDEWVYNIQRIMEHALLKYSVVDIRKQNFIELIKIEEKKDRFNLFFSNENCKYSKEIKSVEIEIPFIKQYNRVFELNGDVLIKT